MALSEERREALRTQARWLALGHYLVAFLVLISTLLPGFYLLYGVALLSGAMNMPASAPLGMVAGCFGGAGVLLLVVMAANTALTGLLVSTQGSRTAVFACTGLNLFQQPFGMVIAMLTLIWMSQGDVHALFDEEAARRREAAGA